MMLFAMLTWWYTAGWTALVRTASRRIDGTLEMFSVSLLLGSLFQPFRQISTEGPSGGGLDVQLRAFGDLLFSRIFGMFVRGLFIFVGLFAALFMGLVALVEIVVWPLVPVLPVIGLVMAVTGWTF
jgi:hypothetical protein